MIDNLPRLAFLPVECLIIHEWHDKQRTPPLIERLQASGVFRNPPVVCPLHDESERYMVLDGANRTTALQLMGYPHALVQIVEADNPELKLENWNHVIWGIPPVEFLREIRQLPEISLLQSEDGNPEPDLWGDCGLALIQIPGRKPYTICTSCCELLKRVDQLNAIVDCYKNRAHLDRTFERRIEPLVGIYPDLSGLVVFPQFDVKDVMNLAGEGYLLPAGITRFTVSPRALHLNYPLEELAAEKPLEVKNEALQRWIQERIARKGVRYYAEATVLFDE
jgi:L-serine kinase (ATP) / ParB family transcriptional regulator, heme-responsive regulator